MLASLNPYSEQTKGYCQSLMRHQFKFTIRDLSFQVPFNEKYLRKKNYHWKIITIPAQQISNPVKH